MYDEIFESIKQDYENGLLTFEEAEVLNNAAYEKYGVVEESTEKETEEITLEEVQEVIHAYLEGSKGGEKSPGDKTVERYIRYYGTKDGRLPSKLSPRDNVKFDKTEKLASNILNNRKSDKKTIKNTKDALADYILDKNEVKDARKRNQSQIPIGETPASVKKIAIDYAKDSQSRIKKLSNIKKESVNDTKLAVYEAFDNGSISDEEKTTLLSLLNE